MKKGNHHYSVYFYYLLIISMVLPSSMHSHVTVVLDPAGNIDDPGRSIDGTSERTSMLQCAQALKKDLEQNKKIKVIISRFPGEYTQQITKAQLANQLHADICIRLQAYQERHPKIQLHLFTYTDFRPHISYDIHTIAPCADAYMIHAQTSTLYARNIADILGGYGRFVNIKQICSIPVSSLFGIRQPAICIEMGLKHATDWHYIVEPLSKAIQKVLSCV